ncbi:MAG TPA: zf-HC2 domain-containing protein [Actinomycetota bacterium]|nr:zf-HC2 domain-containing protein [Actinomycetota bacterium]
MTHPDELLAGYVDGSLGSADRGRVDAHLAECARCRDEVALAAEARSAVAGLGDVAPPPGLSTAVRRKVRDRRPTGRPWRVVGAVAVAAGVAAAGILVVGSLGEEGPSMVSQQPRRPEAAPLPQARGEGPAEDVMAGSEGLAATGTGAVPVVTASRTDYEPKALSPLARRLRDDARAALAQGFPPTATDFYREFDPSAVDTQTRRAVQCALADVSPQQAVVPFIIQEATFQGVPAFVAGFLQGPAPDQPYDRILIWVADKESCALRSLASQQL